MSGQIDPTAAEAMADPTVAEVVATTLPRNVVFAAPADDPRARRPADVARLIGWTIVGLLAAWAYSDGTDVDRRVLEFFSGGLPGWLSAIFTIVFVLGGLYAAGLLLAIWLLGRGRGAVARDMLAAVALAAAVSIITSYLAGPEFPDVVPELFERDGAPSYPVLRLTFAVALVSVARPYLTLPMRSVGRRLVVAMTIAAMVLSYGTISAIIGAVALGTASAAAIHLIFGSGVGIPSRARIGDALRDIGLEPGSIEFLDDQPVGATLLRSELIDHTEVQVKIYGRDSEDAATASRVWRSIWYRGIDRERIVTGVQQTEHESLMLLEGSRAGASVPELVGWGRAATGDALVVTRWLDGRRLAELTEEEIDDDVLARCWHALGDLAAARMAHREIDGMKIVVLDDRVVLDDLSGAIMLPDATTAATDVAQMLVTTATAAGAPRAITAARAGIGDEALEEALPLIQTSALPTTLQRDTRVAKLKLKQLRAELADELGIEAPDPVQLVRVSWANVAMLVLTLVAANALITSLADIGFDTIAQEVADAEWAWVVTALILAQLTNVGEYVSLSGLVAGRVPFIPTINFRYAMSFISLAVPSDAGAIAMNIRYMKKLGVSSAAAVAQGPLLTVFSKGFDIILLIIAGRVIGQTVDLDDVDSGPVLRLILLVVILVVIGTIVTFTVPKLRNQVVPQIREGWTAIRSAVTDPQRLLRVAGGTLISKILFGLTLAASVSAYGTSITFTEAIFVNSAVSLFVGLMPVPGGIGVGEAAITAGLTAVGVPQEAAVAAAITHRMVTAYLPPVYGWFTTRWLTEQDYL